jgi:Flp pilus assembly protein TadG
MSFLAKMRRHAPSDASPIAGVRRYGRFLRLGTTSVELALVAPFILSLAFASIEFSRVVMIKQALTNSAREGCRVATLATTQSTGDVEATIRSFLSQSVANPSDKNTVEITVEPSTFNGITPGTQISTRVEIRFADVAWFTPRWAGDITLIGTADMIRE